MKLGTRDYIVTPSRGQHATVVLEVRQWGVAIGTETITPDQAREFALQLQNAANVAEGK
jgi:hypothetical protein